MPKFSMENVIKGMTKTIEQYGELEGEKSKIQAQLLSNKLKGQQNFFYKMAEKQLQTPLEQEKLKREQLQRGEYEQGQGGDVGGGFADKFLKQSMPQGTITGGEGGAYPVTRDVPGRGVTPTWSPVKEEVDVEGLMQPGATERTTLEGGKFKTQEVGIAKPYYQNLLKIEKTRPLSESEKKTKLSLEKKLGIGGGIEKTTEGKRKTIGAIKGLISKNASLDDIHDFISMSGYAPEDFANELEGYNPVSFEESDPLINKRNVLGIGQKFDKRVKDGKTYEKRKDNLWHLIEEGK